MNEVSSVAAVVTSYIGFGLALYAMGAAFALVWAHHRQDQQSPALKIDIIRASICVIVLLLLEAGRQFTESVRTDQFALWMERLVTPLLYLMLGNSIFRLASIEDEEEEAPVAAVKRDSAAS